MRRLAVLLATLLAATTRVANAQDDRTIADVTINAVAAGKMAIVVRDGEPYVFEDDLRRAGIPVGTATTITVLGAVYVSLASLAPDVRFAFDLAALRLEVTLASRLLPHRRIDLAPSAPADLRYVHATGAMLDYALYAAPGQEVSASFAGRIELGPEGSFEATFGRSTGGTLERGRTDAVFDDRARLRRITIGDQATSDGDLGGSAILGGVSVRRAFELDPYVAYFPMPSLTRTILSPSTAQIYVNGVLVRTIELQPGTYDLNDLPIRQGLTNADVVVRDAFGTVDTSSTDFFGDTSLLKPGLTDYDFAAGLLRQNPFARGDRYAGTAATGTWRRGLSPDATAGLRFESAQGVTDWGASLDAIAAGTFVHASLASSRAYGFSGLAGALGLGFSTDRTAGTAQVRLQSANYATISQAPTADRIVASFAADASYRFARANAFVSALASNYRDGTRAQRLGVGMTRRAGTVNVLFEVFRTSGTGGGGWGALALFSRAIGAHTTVGTTLQSGPGAPPPVSIQIAHSSSSPIGLAYTATAAAGRAGISATAGLSGAQISASVEASPTGTTGTIGIAGAIVATGGEVHLSQPIGDAFALVQTGSPVRTAVFLDNIFVGRTGANGSLLVPFLRADIGNTIDVSERGLPLDRAIDGSARDVVPPYRGGVVLRFRSSLVRAVVGHLIVRTGGVRHVPAFGQATAGSGRAAQVSPIDADGRFYFDRLEPGRHPLIIEDTDRSCSTEIVVPSSEVAVVNIGTVVCDTAGA